MERTFPFTLPKRIKFDGRCRMKTYRKKDFPVSNIRRFMEPGPVVLVSSAWKGEKNIMTMGWHMVMGFEPSLIGCYIWDENHSQRMIKGSRECVINLPEVDIASAVVGIGNCSGREVDKFEKFKLTPEQGSEVKAPLIRECYANFECRVIDASLIARYNLFVIEVVRAHVAVTPKFPKTIHYRGEGLFMIAGETVSRYRKGFRPDMLE